MYIKNLYITLPQPEAPHAAHIGLDQVLQTLQRVEDGGTVLRAVAAPSAPAPSAPAPSAPAPVTTLTPPAPGQPWPGQGGIYICTLPAQFGLPARHLVAGTNEAEDLTWGPYGEEAADAISQTDGRANTAALTASGKGHPAAVWASQYTEDGHADYYLPSRIELLMCYLHAPQVFKTSGWYWSSSQYSRYHAWCQDFECGLSHAYRKHGEFRARPVRSIQL